MIFDEKLRKHEQLNNSDSTVFIFCVENLVDFWHFYFHLESDLWFLIRKKFPSQIRISFLCNILKIYLYYAPSNATPGKLSVRGNFTHYFEMNISIKLDIIFILL